LKNASNINRPAPEVDLQLRQTDDELLAAIGRGDQAAGAEMMRRHLSYVLHICQRKLGNLAEAEEAAQDVFASVWKSAGNWQSGQAKVTTWLFRVASNRCIDILRRRRPTTHIDDIREPSDPSANAEELLAVADRDRLIRAALETLTADQKQAVELVYYKDMKQREAAETMGLSIAALESILRRARAKLHQVLATQPDPIEMI
jgi:RNA polymerase sigma-70 factor (ECF subfamily)